MFKKLALLSTLIVSVQAHALDLAVVGVMNSSNPENSITSGALAGGSPSADGKTSYGFGAIVGWDMMPTLGAEVALLLAPRKFSTQSLGGYHAHLGARFGLGDWLTVGAGPAIHFGGSDSDYVPLDYKKFDLGAFASAQARMPLAPTISLLADVRYVLGLTDVDSSDSLSLKHRDLMVLLGVNFGI